MKDIANEAFGVFEKYKAGQISYDRALEDVSNLFKKKADERPIVGYVRSGMIKKIFYDIFSSKKINSEKSHMFDCQLHQQEMDNIERIFKSL